MFIDVLVIITVGMALVKGYTKGLIMALFSTVSLFIGLAAAVKLSSIFAPWIAESFGVPPAYTPMVSFLVVFLIAVILIRMVGKALEKTFESIKIGFANRFGGMVLYLLIYLSVASVLVYYLEKMGVLDEDMVNQSWTYAWLAPWGPAILDGIGYLVPFFRDMFDELDHFFEKLVAGIGETA